MATHQKKAFITYGALIDFLCPVGKDLILAYDLGDDYATKLQAMFPGTTWSGKTTVICANKENDGFVHFKTDGGFSDYANIQGTGSHADLTLYMAGTSNSDLKLKNTKDLYCYTRNS